MSFTATPLDGSTTPIPMSSVVPDGTNTPTALEGGPAISSGGNNIAPASMYIKDGNDVTQGTSTDANTVNSVMGRLTKIRDLLSATLAISGNVTEANSAAIKADLDAINTAIGAVSDAAWSGTGNGSEIAILKKIEAVLAATLTVAGAVTANAGTNLNTSALALESGGNLAAILVDTNDIETNTANIPPLGQALATGSVPVVLTAAQQAALTPPAAITNFALESGGNLASILAALDDGQETMANSLSVAIASDQSAVPVSGTFWQATQPVSGSVSVSNFPGTQPVSGTVTANQGGAPWSQNVTQVAGNNIAPGSNAIPILSSAASGYVAAFGSNPAALTASTDYSFKWGAGGTTQVNHVMLQNNTALNLNYDLDVAATAGSPVLLPGQTVFFDVLTTVLHLFQAGTPNVNGTTAGNIVVRGWL